jgi:hypothetical protein
MYHACLSEARPSRKFQYYFGLSNEIRMMLRLDGATLTLENLTQIAEGGVNLQLASEGLERMARSAASSKKFCEPGALFTA